MALRVLYFGTPGFAVPSLVTIADSTHEVIGVITQPDRPRGRGQKVQVEAVKAAALERQLPVWQPERLKDPEFLSLLAGLQPDIGVVAAYGRILPQVLLDLPRFGFINVHASLLPRWRGAAPVHRAVIAGDETTGVTIMRVVFELDAGPMLSHATTPIGPDETSEELETRLAQLGAQQVVPVLDAIARGDARDAPQDERYVVYASKIERADSPVDWTAPASTIHNRIRGLRPWPLASTSQADRRVLLLRSRVDEGLDEREPGTIVNAGADGIIVATGAGRLRLLELQLEGRRPMSARDFLNGARLIAGDRFR